MHAASLVLMKSLLRRHALKRKWLSVIDVGSHERNEGGSYRPLVESLKFKSYTGIDIEAGPNVDVVVPQIGDWSAVLAVATPKFPLADIVISGQCLEHVRMPWVWIQQVASILKPGGMIIIIAPWNWRIHRYPVDCWRILPDGAVALFEWAGLEMIETDTEDRDCFAVGMKPEAKNNV